MLLLVCLLELQRLALELFQFLCDSLVGFILPLCRRVNHDCGLLLLSLALESVSGRAHAVALDIAVSDHVDDGKVSQALVIPFDELL